MLIGQKVRSTRTGFSYVVVSNEPDTLDGRAVVMVQGERGYIGSILVENLDEVS